MTEKQWNIFCDFKKELKQKIEEWTERAPKLTDLQKEAARLAKNTEYSFETPVVYNHALNDVQPQDDIKLIVIGDNPGKDEQLKINNRYLVGQAGKIAEGYFRRNPELGVDFRRNVIILNKTPIHSAKTIQLNTIAKLGGPEISVLIKESQIWMAEKTAALHAELGTELWLVGYSELKDKKIFCPYRDALKNSLINRKDAWNRVYVFQHFSMNRFTIDLSEYIKTEKKENARLESNIHELGVLHKKEIFGAQ